MSLYTQLKADRITAMKEKQKERKDTLTVFIGDLDSDEKRGETIDDQYVIKRLKKAIQNARDNHEITGEEKYVTEQKLYEAYLPSQLSSEELASVINEIIAETDKPNIGTIMKELKSRYDGQYDGKTASMLIKQKL